MLGKILPRNGRDKCSTQEVRYIARRYMKVGDRNEKINIQAYLNSGNSAQINCVGVFGLENMGNYVIEMELYSDKLAKLKIFL